MSMPSILMCPVLPSIILNKADANVDFPAPLKYDYLIFLGRKLNKLTFAFCLPVRPTIPI